MSLSVAELDRQRDSASATRSRCSIYTDHRISQLPWWGETLEVLRPQPKDVRFATVRTIWRVVRDSRAFDVFVSGSVRNTAVVGFVKRLTGRRKPAIVLTEMRLDDPRPGLRWKLKIALQRFAYQAVDVLCVCARREAEAYSARLRVPKERFRFVPWHTNVLEPRILHGRGYVFAAGRTGRDWRTFAEAVRNVTVPVVVVCGHGDASLFEGLPHVEAFTEIPYARYRELLEAASVVAVPLENHVYSSGQVVFLEAMSLGKPVVVTRVLGSEDYIEDGVDGLMVECSDAVSLSRAITRLAEDHAFAESLGRNALAKINRGHTLEQYARQIVAIAQEAGTGR